MRSEPIVDESPNGATAEAEEPKPRLRGRLHQVAFIVSIPAGLTLVALAERPAARAAAAVYAFSLIGLYGTSAAYHVGQWSSQALRRMRRLDHSMIYVLIAGTYTPIAVLAMEGAWAVTALAIVWAGALFGVVLKLARVDGFQVLSGVLYIGLGWFAVFAFPQIVRTMGVAQLVLIVAGGLLYTGGAIILALRRPNPRPAVFGYHEIWHAMGIAAGACHYVAILRVAVGS
jgi:hemolysin III